MNKDGLLRELRSTLGDLFRDADAGDSDARQWLFEAFPAHEQFFKCFWSGLPERSVHLTPRDLKLLENAAWNIESRLLINRLSRMVENEHTNNPR